jgi:hypothetical protein
MVDGPLCQRVIMLCFDTGRFAANPVWRQDDVWLGLWCETRTHYIRGALRLASEVVLHIDFKGNLVWPD